MHSATQAKGAVVRLFRSLMGLRPLVVVAVVAALLSGVAPPSPRWGAGYSAW